MKILLFANDLMPFAGLPTSGGGLRCWQMYQGLLAHGFEVVVSMPAFTFLVERHKDKLSAELKEQLWEFGGQERIIARVKPDAVLFSSNWYHVDLHKSPNIPVIVDLHGSWLLETSMWNRPLDLNRKLKILAQADCLLAAGQRQRLYYYGWLVQAGRVPEGEHFIRYIPVSMSPDQPTRGTSGLKRPHLVSGGGWFPWQDQSKALFAVAERVLREQRGNLSIYGTPHERVGLSAREAEIHRIYAKMKEFAGQTKRIEISDYVGRDQLLQVYRSADVAVELMRYNLERELAFTTRTIEYLWSGLPVLYNDFGEIAAHIRDYNAGWTVNPDDPIAINAALDEIFNAPEIVRERGANAQRLVAERFNWATTIQPLVDFLNAPVKAPAVTPAYGLVSSRPSFLAVRGDETWYSLSKERPCVETEFIVPADDIGSVDIPLRRSDGDGVFEKLELSVRNQRGFRIARRRFSKDHIPQNGRISLPFPAIFQPRGGTVLKLKVELVDGREGRCLMIQGTSHPKFPLVTNYDKNSRTYPRFSSQIGSENGGENSTDRCFIALSFSPGDHSPVFRARMLIQRAWALARRGDWRRIQRALERRIQWAIYRLRNS